MPGFFCAPDMTQRICDATRVLCSNANNNRSLNGNCKTAGLGTGSIRMTCLNAPPTTRLKIAVRGAVQGVGFRPFVHRLAAELGLAGWVNNSSQGVFIEAEGSRAGLEQFLLRLQTEKPPRSFIHSLESWWLDAAGTRVLKSGPAKPAPARRRSSCRTLPLVPNACARFLIRGTGGISIRSPIAPIAGRASRLWSRSPTIAPTPP